MKVGNVYFEQLFRSNLTSRDGGGSLTHGWGSVNEGVSANIVFLVFLVSVLSLACFSTHALG